MKKDYEYVYAIIRCDNYLGDDCPIHEKITVKAIVWSEDEAAREVARLSSLQEPNESYYFSQVTRLLSKPVVEPKVQPSQNEPVSRTTQLATPLVEGGVAVSTPAGRD